MEASDEEEDTAFIGHTDGKPFQKRDEKHSRNQCPPRPKVQCNVCMMFGHTGNCDFMAKLYWTLEHMKTNADASKIVGLAFKKCNEPDTQARINAAHASVASSLLA